ncbi:winged helix-turn-helix transcriptional regulator [Kitasatospora paranensis]|uniref:Winged helix-turn-helix transcriptional regulator n=1 Tax=Kitasatospora paranensis TaxID=258053 RepID=A0ABW2G3Z2_9ACTN
MSTNEDLAGRPADPAAAGTHEPRRRPAPRECSIARTLDVVGEKWSLLALREVFFGERRFEQIVANTGAPRDILTARLRKLTDAGVLDRVQYSERPPRFEYHLTQAGRDLQPVLLTLMHWGDRHLAGGQPPPTVWTHTCGHTLTPRVTCESCTRPVEPDSLVRESGTAV